MSNVIEKVRNSFQKNALPAHSILSKFNYISPEQTNRAFFYDPKYYPFYFYLGRHVKAENVLDLSFGGGVPLGCYLLAKPGTQRVLAFQRNVADFYSSRLGEHNVRTVYGGELDIHVGSLDDSQIQVPMVSRRWHLVLMTEILPYDECLGYLRALWPYVARGGLIIIDYINYDKSMGRAHRDFVDTNNRDAVVIDTKYGVGLICK